MLLEQFSFHLSRRRQKTICSNTSNTDGIDFQMISPTEGNGTNVVNNAPAPKKAALRDENVGTVSKQQDTLLPGGGKSTQDTVKVRGTKRLTPERPSISRGLQSLAYNETNENIVNVRRRFDLELGIGRVQNNVEKYAKSSEFAQKMNQMKDNSIQHVAAPAKNNVMPPVAIHSSSVRNTSRVPVAAKVSGEKTCSVDSRGRNNDQIRDERFIRLQKYLKQCDEANKMEYIQMLSQLSPADLCKRAVELEKRAVQLTMEEGSEMQRMKALNILAKSFPTNDG